MPRDYARNRSTRSVTKNTRRGTSQRNRNPRRKNSDARQVKPLLWLSIGLCVGLLIAGLIYLNNNGKGGLLEQAKVQLKKTNKKLAQSSKKTSNKTSNKTSTTKKKASKRYDFYTILSNPEEANDAKAKTVHNINQQYILQIASFKNFKDADNLKAKLALMGFEARIQKSKIGVTQWNRVWVGPFKNMTKANNIRLQLQENRIESLLLTQTR